jgi:hypothetical protein
VTLVCWELTTLREQERKARESCGRCLIGWVCWWVKKWQAWSRPRLVFPGWRLTETWERCKWAFRGQRGLQWASDWDDSTESGLESKRELE